MELNTTTEYKIAPQGTLQAFFTKVAGHDAVRSRSSTRTVTPSSRRSSLKARAFAKLGGGQRRVRRARNEVRAGRAGQRRRASPSRRAGQGAARRGTRRWWTGSGSSSTAGASASRGALPASGRRWEKTTTRNLNFAVETPGKLEVEVTGVGLDFENIARCRPRASAIRGCGARTSRMAGQSVLMTKDRLAGKWTRHALRALGQAGRVPRRVSAEEREDVCEGLDEDERADPEHPRLAPEGRRAGPDVDSGRPLDRRDPGGAVAPLRRRQLPARCAVQLQEARRVQEVGGAAAEQQQAEVRYKILATFKNGDVQETEWLSREGDQACRSSSRGRRAST